MIEGRGERGLGGQRSDRQRDRAPARERHGANPKYITETAWM